VRNDPKRPLDGLEQTGLSNALLADDDQLDGRVDDGVFLKRAEVLTHISGALREVGWDVDEWVGGERNTAQSTESRHGDGQLRQFVVVYSEIFQ